VDDSLKQRYNQVKGVNIKAYFEGDEIRRAYVYEKSETIYYLREDNGKKIGINKAIGRNVLVTFKGNEISSISFLEKPEGTMFPDAGLSGPDKFLRNFEWFGSLRPLSKTDIYRWK
jgi:hypothetical protein